MGFFRTPKSLIGLDIGSSAVKAVELARARRRPLVVACGAAPVPPGAIVAGTIVQPEAVADAVRRALHGGGTARQGTFSSAEVCTSLPGGTVIVKRITLPVMTASELDESIRWEAEQHIPFDLQDINLDYQILDDGTGADARGGMEVLVVAAKKEQVGDRTSVVAQAGRSAAVVDVDSFALQNVYEWNHGFEPGRLVMLLNAGASALTVTLLFGDRSLVSREIPIGGHAYTDALQRELGLSFAAAEHLKLGVPIAEATFEDARATIDALTEQLLGEIEKTVEFLKPTMTTDRVGRIVLSGGASQVEGLRRALQDRFNAPVEPLDPFRVIDVDPAIGPLPSPVVGVAVGLALREAVER